MHKLLLNYQLILLFFAQIQSLKLIHLLKIDGEGKFSWDQSALLNAMNVFWMDAFKTVLGRAERAIINELVEVRNKLSHNETFTYDDADFT